MRNSFDEKILVMTSPLLSNVRTSQSNDNASNSSACQGCGAGTQISDSSFSSGHLIFLAPAPEQFGPKNEKKYCIICITRLLHKLYMWNRNPNFRLRLHHLKVFGSGSSRPKLLRLRDSAPQSCCVLDSTIIARVAGQFIVRLKWLSKWELSTGLGFNPMFYTRGGESIYFHGPHKLFIISGGPPITIYFILKLYLYLTAMDRGFIWHTIKG